MLRKISLLLAVGVVIGLPVCALAERRVALVIGNSAYKHTTELKNPRNDARDLAVALRGLNFEVLEGIDLDKRSMEQLVNRFNRSLIGVDLALFFYAGHGVQIGGSNYLLPVDAQLAREGDEDFETLSLTTHIFKQMEREAKTSIILLDACRNNPLAQRMVRSAIMRSAPAEGLAELKLGQAQAGSGVLIGYSTQPGNVAADGAGKNSPYAEALLRLIATPDAEFQSVLNMVRKSVIDATFGMQRPWEQSSLVGTVKLNATAPKSEPAAAAPTAARDTEREMELALWNAVKDSNSVPALRSYVERFPKGTFARFAELSIARLEANGAAQEAANEAQRKAEDEHRAAEAQRKVDEERRTAEVQRKAEEDRRAAEVQRKAEEERRVAEAQRKVDEQKAAAELRDLTLRIQKELARRDCYDGETDGKWGSKTEAALKALAKRTSLSVAMDRASTELFDALRARPSSAVCESAEAADTRESNKPKRQREEIPERVETPKPKASGSPASSSPAIPQLKGYRQF